MAPDVDRGIQSAVRERAKQTVRFMRVAADTIRFVKTIEFETAACTPGARRERKETHTLHARRLAGKRKPTCERDHITRNDHGSFPYEYNERT